MRDHIFFLPSHEMMVKKGFKKINKNFTNHNIAGFGPAGSSNILVFVQTDQDSTFSFKQGMFQLMKIGQN